MTGFASFKRQGGSAKLDREVDHELDADRSERLSPRQSVYRPQPISGGGSDGGGSDDEIQPGAPRSSGCNGYANRREPTDDSVDRHNSRRLTRVRHSDSTTAHGNTHNHNRARQNNYFRSQITENI